MSEIEHYMKLVAQLRRQAEVDTAALSKYKALADDAAALFAVLSIPHDATYDEIQQWMARYEEARR